MNESRYNTIKFDKNEGVTFNNMYHFYCCRKLGIGIVACRRIPFYCAVNLLDVPVDYLVPFPTRFWILYLLESNHLDQHLREEFQSQQSTSFHQEYHQHQKVMVRLDQFEG